MLLGKLVCLRPRHEDDVAVLHAELYENVSGRSRSHLQGWVPIPSGPRSPYAVPAPSESAAVFSVVERATGDLAGEASLWGIDLHNRSAHLGLSLRPAFRGRGLGTDIVTVLTDYGFRTRGLHRLQLETLTDNAAMIAAAARAGFRREGTLRQSGWVNGVFTDDAILGLLAQDWSDSCDAQQSAPTSEVPATQTQ
ncbi:GNAT family N-acetyltransferase [Leekyejoonella antrihumi]|uniref:GNAT family N-acetyltransferase n=2 Tax=Leekyejoonella antrihumi TaxID=1660198 RepID=A0A563DTG5_9MICO|nr:GNAT family N-acetyltransferase [Leekyejoonella antrihumi]